MKLADELKNTTAIVKAKDLSNMNQIHELFQELQQEKIHYKHVCGRGTEYD
jgi:short-subunit dehydrogenase